jgi:uncharacterized protein (DUF488 family)
VHGGAGSTIYTIGHGARTADDLAAELRRVNIRRLVDVRTAPGSRKHPQLGKDALAATLSQHGIGYEWYRELGGWRKAVPDSPHIAIRSPGFRGYADHMETGEFKEALARLIESSREVATAVMCAETLWWRCHRRMLADTLHAGGWDVIHLVGDRQQPHRLHPTARIEEGGRLLYDRTEPDRGASLQLPLT